jgi:hypothetical protein
MAIDLTTETCLTLSKAAKRLPRVRGSKPPHPMTLYRWATVGLKAKSGDRVLLETEFIGGTRITSLEALTRFFTRKNDREYRPLNESQQRQSDALAQQTEQAVARLRSSKMI